MSATGRFVGRAIQVAGGLILAGFIGNAVWQATVMSDEASFATRVLVGLLSGLPGIAVGGVALWAGIATVRRNSAPPRE